MGFCFWFCFSQPRKLSFLLRMEDGSWMVNSMVISFLYLLILFILQIFTNHFLHRIRNLPPSPFLSLPIIGQLYLLKAPLHRTLSEISRRHGPILFFQFGFRPVLVVSSPSAVEDCLSKNDVIFANRPRLVSGKYLGYNYTSLLWAPYGEHWRNLRRISSLEILSSHRLQTLSSIRVDEVRKLIRRLYNAENDVVDMRTEFFELMFNIMMRMIAGKRYYGEAVVADSEEGRRFQEIQEETFRLSGKTNLGDFLRVVKWVGLSKGIENRLRELQIRRDDWMQSLIEEHRKKMDNAHSSSSSSIQGDAKKTMIEVLLLAGTEGSINTMEWLLSLLLNHPHSLRRAQMEIDNVVGKTNRLLEESDLTHLPYLRSLIHETLRMYPPGPLLIPHESSQDCHVGGFHVPAGTMLFVNVWAIQNDPTVWVEPEKFNPDRFKSDGEGFKWMPFGAGRRRCPGESLGLRVVGLVIGSLIQCFEWESMGGKCIDMSEGGGLTLPKALPLRTLCRPRSNATHLLSQI
uniref:Cytochrome P450 81E8-like n=1 Tax=Cucumis melo TaxID=3656 RepID=A0A9I9DDC3_CUCME